jgi:hypothetical protein
MKDVGKSGTEGETPAYFDSLTGITESESGESSEELKITGKPEITRKMKIRKNQKKQC